MKKIGLVLLSSALLVASGFTAAQAETVVCTVITSLPYNITAQGVYCLTGHLNTNISGSSEAAITINTNNVVLDLNGFKIGGLAAGLGTQAVGIWAYQRQNITIKNGTVRGFVTGIKLGDTAPYTTSQGNLIEDVRLDQNTVLGMYVFGKGNMIRNNQVVATGGSTNYGANALAGGIVVVGPGARVINNDVTDVTAQGTENAAGIKLSTASNGVVAGNRVSNITSPAGAGRGIALDTGSDILVSDNRVSGATDGIFFNTATGKYMNNMTMGVTTPYTGGTAAGTTNY